MIEVILWDLDGTLLDFKASEKSAIRAAFHNFGLGELSDRDVAAYSRINLDWWTRMERGEATKPQVLQGRFRDFFLQKRISPPDLTSFNEVYQDRLGEVALPFKGAVELVASLKQAGIRQYAVTNGTARVQRARLKKCGLDRLFDGVFISEDVGFEKPDRRFFDAVFASIPPVDKRSVLIVGDSVSGDMAGGRNAGILTCLYRPEGDGAPSAAHYRIRSLSQVSDLIRTVKN